MPFFCKFLGYGKNSICRTTANSPDALDELKGAWIDDLSLFLLCEYEFLVPFMGTMEGIVSAYQVNINLVVEAVIG